jgi:hypothetical protein
MRPLNVGAIELFPAAPDVSDMVVKDYFAFSYG